MIRRNKGFAEVTLILAACIAAGFVLSTIIAYWKGVEHTKAKYEAKNAILEAQRAQMISDLAIELGNRANQRWADDQKVKNELNRIEQEWKKPGIIIRYLPPNPERERNCPVTTGWVQYHDERAAGVPPSAGPSAGTAGTPSGVKEAEALETVGDNYSTYFKCKERVREILNEFDDIRTTTNSVVNRINKRLERAERKVQ